MGALVDDVGYQHIGHAALRPRDHATMRPDCPALRSSTARTPNAAAVRRSQALGCPPRCTWPSTVTRVSARHNSPICAPKAVSSAVTNHLLSPRGPAMTSGSTRFEKNCARIMLGATAALLPPNRKRMDNGVRRRSDAPSASLL